MTVTEAEAPAEVPGVLIQSGTPNLNAALARVQAELPELAKNEKGKIEGTTKDGRPYSYDYKYADLAACSMAILPLLGANGLAFTTKPTTVGGRFGLVYKLVHESGEFDGGFFPLPSEGKIQTIGANITYARRYTLCCVTGIAPAGEDDDAASANERQRFDTYQSAGAAFDAATPAPPRNRQRQENVNPRPAVEVAPLPEDDPWRDAIEGITDRDQGHKLYEDVSEQFRAKQISEQRAKQLAAQITARVISLDVAAGEAAADDHSEQAAQEPPPRIRQEDQGAPKPDANGAGGENAEWVGDFLTRVAAALTGTDLNTLMKEIGPAVRSRLILPATSAELTEAISKRRKEVGVS